MLFSLQQELAEVFVPITQLFKEQTLRLLREQQDSGRKLLLGVFSLMQILELQLSLTLIKELIHSDGQLLGTVAIRMLMLPIQMIQQLRQMQELTKIFVLPQLLLLPIPRKQVKQDYGLVQLPDYQQFRQPLRLQA